MITNTAPPRRGFSRSAGTLFSGRPNNAISVLFLGYRKCMDLIFIYLSELMISDGNLELLKLASIADK
jgi:hypothetical protein